MITAHAFREDTGDRALVEIVCGHCGVTIKPESDIFQSGWRREGWISTGKKFVRYTCPDCILKESQR